MIIEGQKVSDEQWITWAWSLLKEQEDTGEQRVYINSLCLDCGAINVDENHECKERQVA